MSKIEKISPREQPGIDKVDRPGPTEHPGRSQPTNEPKNLPDGGGGDDQGFGPGANLPNTNKDE